MAHPNVIPRWKELPSIFWDGARIGKEQSAVLSRCQSLAEERIQCAGIEDDGKEHGALIATPPLARRTAVLVPRAPSSGSQALLAKFRWNLPPRSFPAIQPRTLTTGSWQGSSVLFGCTFASKVLISPGYDDNVFEKKVVERFWEGMWQLQDSKPLQASQYLRDLVQGNGRAKRFGVLNSFPTCLEDNDSGGGC
ncbi:hypothetical protein BU15DRAFT_70877 [Melanogaster broomeanus]|nr:hypothetical protein BU15DRAFT_70877 [Melanogaster broomeanus]